MSPIDESLDGGRDLDGWDLDTGDDFCIDEPVSIAPRDGCSCRACACARGSGP